MIISSFLHRCFGAAVRLRQRSALVVTALLLPVCCATYSEPDAGQPGGADTSAANTVFVIFKTHLDVGFTDLPSKVEAQYLKNDIPQALDVIAQLKKLNGGRDRYVWTVGTWILSEYLERASDQERERVEQAIADGDIVWNAAPYTIETESTTAELLNGMLMLSRRLDERYGKQTLAAKMTDVPGHTRGIVSPLCHAGIRLLHVGMNRSTTEPQIPVAADYPGICRWRHPDGSEVLLLWKKAYSHIIDLPRGNVLSMNVRNDNLGPHTVAQVQRIYADLRTKYPGKRIVASDLNHVARVLDGVKEAFPVFTGEIGDTWIHGFGSSPARMAKVRALGRLYREWIGQGRLDPAGKEAVDFAIRLGLVAEHTWGVDCVKYLKNETPDKYNIAGFNASRMLPEFLFLERSWQEIDVYVEQAVCLLPAALQAEARQAMAQTEELPARDAIEGRGGSDRLTPEGAYRWQPAGSPAFAAGVLTFQTFGFADFRAWTLSWMTATGAKGGMEGSEAVPAKLHPEVRASEVRADGVYCDLRMTDPRLNRLLYPASLRADYRPSADGRSLEVDFTLFDKPANRMAEAYWLSFVPEGVAAIVVEKLGSRVDVTEVVEGGNARMMGVDRYVELQTRSGNFRIYPLDAPLVLVGDLNDLSYKTRPDVSKGVHFCLFNNLWGVNYSMWWEGSQRFRFRIEKL